MSGWLLAFVMVSTGVVVGVPAYLMGRAAGREQGSVDAWHRIAQLNRRGARS